MELIIVGAIGYFFGGFVGAAWALVGIYAILPIIWGILCVMFEPDAPKPVNAPIDDDKMTPANWVFVIVFGLMIVGSMFR